MASVSKNGPCASRARQIAYMPQVTATAFPFQVVDVVLSGRTPHVPRFRLEGQLDRERAMEALESTGAAHLAGRCLDRSFRR